MLSSTSKSALAQGQPPISFFWNINWFGNASLMQFLQGSNGKGRIVIFIKLLGGKQAAFNFMNIA
jgi:hypothetical protein